MRLTSLFLFVSAFSVHLVHSQSTTALPSTTPVASRTTSSAAVTNPGSSSTAASPAATNTNLAVVFDPIPGALYACAAYKFTWTLPADLAPASRSALIDLFVTNENIDQAIPAQGGSPSSGSQASSTSSRAVSSSTSRATTSSSAVPTTDRPATTSTPARAGTSSSSPAVTTPRTTTSQAARGLPNKRGSAALPLLRRDRHLSPVSNPILVSRDIPSGNKLIKRNITLVTASSNAYNYPSIVLPLGRYVIYATQHGNAGEVLGTSAPFTVLNGANPSCLNSSDIQPDPTGITGGSEGSDSKGASGGTIAGVVVGAIVGTLLIAFVAFWFWRKRQRKSLWLSQSSRRMFDSTGDGQSGWKGFLPGGLGGVGGGRNKRNSQRSSARGFNEPDISGPIVNSTPTSTGSSAWSPVEGSTGHQTRPSNSTSYGHESKEEEEKDMGVHVSQRDQGRSIEMGRLQLAPPLEHGVGLNIPVLNKDQGDPRRLSRSGFGPIAQGYSSRPTSPQATSPAKSWNAHSSAYDPERDDRSYHPDDVTLSTPSSQRHPSGVGLQRNASTASTTLGIGAGIGRSLSNKRHSSGLASSMKRKPVPVMGGSPREAAEGQPPRLADFGQRESPEEMLTEERARKNPSGSHDQMSRQSSSGSLAVSSSEGTIRPGRQGAENNSRRSSYLLMPDRPLDQEP